MRSVLLAPRFVESIPEELEGGVLYVSMTFATAIHLCACGCGCEVVTPLSPTDWKLWFDGEHVTLDPSVGNWSFPCRSHYWISKNDIRWAPSMSETTVREIRALDRARKTSLIYEADVLPNSLPEPSPVSNARRAEDGQSFWHAMWNTLRFKVLKRPAR
jgi:Family of unknown function (DUF6527)